MTFALIEVEATAKKAARGAGYSWGMSEEAAKATRWLCAQGIDGVAALSRALELADGAGLAARAPARLDGDWQAEAGVMCPLIAGATLSDSAVMWSEDGKRIGFVAAPVLLLPFAAMAARTLATTVTVAWAGVQAATNGSVTSLEAVDPSALLDLAKEVKVQIGGTVGTPLPQRNRATPSEVDWTVLNRFAHRTYAPDTEASRLKGAGAGLTDND